MTSQRTRARRADRDRAIAAIDAAYADEQLSDTEHDDRISRALRAITLGELIGLTADLQVDQPASPTPHPPRPRVAMVVASIVAVLGLAWGLTALNNGPDSTQPAAEPVAPDAVAPDEAPEAPADELGEGLILPGDPQTAAGFVAFRDAYRAVYGETLVYEMDLRADSVDLEVAFGDDPPRSREVEFTLDGLAGEAHEPVGRMDDAEPFDLADIDPRKLEENFIRARKELRVPDVDWAYASVTWEDDRPVIEYFAIGTYDNESGYLVADFDGKILRRYPFAPAG